MPTSHHLFETDIVDCKPIVLNRLMADGYIDRVPGGVDIWYIPFLANLPFRKSQLEILSQYEINRARKYHLQEQRARYINSHLLLRVIFSKYLNLAPGEIMFTETSTGKPILAGMDQSAVHFSYSRSGDHAVYAFSQDYQLGIDCEVLESAKFDSQIIEHSFSKQEIEVCNHQPRASRSRTFLGIWTRKEAFLKGMGLGLKADLKRFSVTDDSVKLMGVDETETYNLCHERDIWQLHSFQPSPEVMAALAIKSKVELLANNLRYRRIVSA